MKAWTDAHCHLSLPISESSRDDQLKALAAQGCRGIVLGGIDAQDWQEQLQLPAHHLRIIRAFGLHPWTIHDRKPEELQEQFALLEKILIHADGIGEIGLDFFRAKADSDRDQQRAWFRRQLELALQIEKPLILHIVKAHHEVLQILKSYSRPLRGLVHGFWASPAIAEAYLALGFYVSLPPRILRADPHHLLSTLPKDRILFESDSPHPLPDGSFTTSLLAEQLQRKASQVWKEELSTVCSRHNHNLTMLFPEDAPIKERKSHA